MAQPQKPEQPAVFPEGGVAPTTVPALTPEAVAALAPAPTEQDYLREHRTYRALSNLVVDGNLAVLRGAPVPASHPYLRDAPNRPGWVTEGLVELTGQHDAPEDLAALHEAREKALKES